MSLDPLQSNLILLQYLPAYPVVSASNGLGLCNLSNSRDGAGKDVIKHNTPSQNALYSFRSFIDRQGLLGKK